MFEKRGRSHSPYNFLSENQKGQVTIFVIIAIVLVAAVAAFFFLRGTITLEKVPASMNAFYKTFESCIEDETRIAIDVAESQAGYVYLPELETGSYYMPFSSQLNFVGTKVPYWYYISGSNIEREQVPTKSEISGDTERFVEERIKNCELEEFYGDGFEVVFGEKAKAEVTIEDEEVIVNLNLPMTITKNEETAYVKDHKVYVNSKLGTLYDSAKKLYDYEQQTLFLEKYAVDTLRLYAPVDGVELTCSPIVMSADKVFNDLAEAIEQNTLSLKTSDGDYSLKNQDNRYFVVEVETGSNVRFINSKNWSNLFEVSPSDDGILKSEPIGNQAGLGVLGFCYVPYHFVYNAAYPVLIQIENDEETFQFPVVVVIEGNQPRTAMNATAEGIGESSLCKYLETPVEVSTYDNNFNYIEAEISYRCLESTCELAKTSSDGPTYMAFPQCVNGYVTAKAEGFKEGETLFSTVNGGSVDIILDKLYEQKIKLQIDGKDYNGDAIISFISEDGEYKTIIYPEQKNINLSEGQYEIQVSVYKNSSLKIGELTQTQCMEISQGGLGGIVGLTEEKCFDVTIPPQIISNVLSAGGKGNYYALESELADSNEIEINTQSFPVVNSLQKLQENYNLFDESKLNIELK